MESNCVVVIPQMMVQTMKNHGHKQMSPPPLTKKESINYKLYTIVYFIIIIKCPAAIYLIDITR